MGDKRLDGRDHGQRDEKVDDLVHAVVIPPFVGDRAQQRRREVRHAADRALRAVAHRLGELPLVADEDGEVAVLFKQRLRVGGVAGGVLDASRPRRGRPPAAAPISAAEMSTAVTEGMW